MDKDSRSTSKSRDRCIALNSVVPRIYRDLDTKVSRACLKSLRGDHSQLIEMSVDPSTYSNVDVFRRDWLAINLMGKYPNLDLGINTKDVAMEKFFQAESQCAETNRRLRAPYATPSTSVTGESLLWSARRKIQSLLGAFCWNKAYERMGFSTGASTRLGRRHGDPYYKFQDIPEVTSEAALLACCAIESSPLWSADMRDRVGIDPENWIKVVSGNRLDTVPKSAKTDRMIAIEPCMNMFMQRGIGSLIRSRLKRVGIDLDDQTNNQRLALRGSIDGSYATIDLAAASDTVSTALVEVLLPQDWFDAMDLVRSKRGILPSGKVITYSKFSSMGNGFTFELESLIFWALCSAVKDYYPTESDLLVYGDDIVCPTAISGSIIELLEYCGFKTNDDKSFINGPFRESCGKHYFLGVDVTPFYVRKPVLGRSARYWLANSVKYWAAHWSDNACDPRYRSVYNLAVSKIRPSDRLVIPAGIGNGGLIGSLGECKTTNLIEGSRQVKYFVEICGEPFEITNSRYGYFRVLSGFKAGGPIELHSYDDKWEIPADLRKNLDKLFGKEKHSVPSVTLNRDKIKGIKVEIPVVQWNDGPFWPS